MAVDVNDVINNRNLQAITNDVIDPPIINGNEYDYIFSFFKKAIKDKIIAEQFTRIIYQVAAITEIAVLSLVDSMRDQESLELTESMAYYLNSIGTNYTLVGVKNVIKPNFYASRNVVS